VVVGLGVGLVLGFVFGHTSRPAEARASTARPAQVAAAQPAAPARPAPKVSSTVFRVPVDGSPVSGPEDARVTIVEFSDYECPFCSRAHVTMKQLQERYGNKVRLVMKHNPLPMHPRAPAAAVASLAAHEQGKFWEYHDKLFANARALDDASLERYAREVGLDVERWKRSLADPRHAERIRQDQALAGRIGANGTPNFSINGRLMAGALPAEAFQAVIDEELRKADALVSGGVKPHAVYAAIMERGVDSPPPPPEPAVQKVEVGNAPSRGPKDAPVTLVAFSDFECPFCSRAVPTLKQLEEEYKGRLRVAFKHQPLPNHANARTAAAASLAAHEQGRFWEFHDVLFANQRALDRASLERHAQQVGLDLGRFRAALDSGKYEAHIAADMSEAARVGASGTPTFYINGRQLVGAMPIDHFRRLIDDELRKAGVAAR
jgi:protein-disulfide isomerase